MVKVMDYERFKVLLQEVIPSAYTALRQLIGSETLYAFGLYTCGEAVYVWPTANTKEGLNRAAQKYSLRYGKSIETCVDQLRWNPCDWAYHDTEAWAIFNPAQEILNQAWEEDFSGANIDAQRVFKICLNVLGEQSEQGLFGRGTVRSKIILGLWKGDQSSRELLQYLRLLNPEEALERFDLINSLQETDFWIDSEN